MKDTYKNYWGKADRKSQDYHLLIYHCLDVAAVGQTLLEKNTELLEFFSAHFQLNSAIFKEWIKFFLALHDIGKFSDGFQQLRPEIAKHLGRSAKEKLYKKSHLHDTLGLLLWNDFLLEKCIKDNWLNITGLENSPNKQYLGNCLSLFTDPVFGHHGAPVFIDKGSLLHKFTQQNCNDANLFVCDISKLFISQKSPSMDTLFNISKSAKSVSWWLAGFISICDWIGSDSSIFKFSNSKNMSLENYWNTACKKAVEAINKCGILPPEPSAQKTFQSLFSDIKTLTPLQKYLSEIELKNSPHLFILEDATGSGKTEASLILAHRLISQGLGLGVYIGLPTMATANAMYERIEKVYKTFFSDKESEITSLVLAHSAMNLNERFQQSIRQTHQSPETPEELSTAAYCSYWLSDNRKKSLLAPFGVGTIDQLLISVLTTKYQSLRLFGVRQKVLILDEVHASDAYMHQLTQRLLKVHAASGGSAILLSATLPQQMKQELLGTYNGNTETQLKSNAYPLVTHCDALTKSPIETPLAIEPRCQKVIKWKLFDDKTQLLRQLIEAIKAGSCGAWICNTVKEAISLYEEAKKHYPDIHITLFHARFAMGDRLNIEEKIKSIAGKNSSHAQRTCQLVIATQVIEQSMDLDFDWMVSDLCPIDLLIQRAGRLHRHTRNNKGKIQPEDSRGIPEFWIHAPHPSRQCKNEWYSSFAKSSSKVYPDHGQLWLTARYIQNTPEFHIPENLRDAIQWVFDDENFSHIPEALQASSCEHDGKDRSKDQLARWNAITFESGYTAQKGKWENDIYAPTRLEDHRTTTIRLAKWVNGKLLPWASHQNPQKAWALSEISVSEYLVSQEAVQEKELASALKALKESWPGKPEFYTVIPLSKDSNKLWTGVAKNSNQNIRCIYNPSLGFTKEL